MSAEPAAPQPPAESVATPWRVRLGRMAAMFLGVVLLSATVTKVVDPAGLQEMIEIEGLDFVLPSGLMVFVVLALEGGLGLALLLGVRRLWTLIPACLLVALFVFLTGKAYVQSLMGELDPHAACGCFGNLVDRTPAEAFWQDLALLVPALALSFVGRRRGAPFPRRRTLAVAAFSVVLVVFAVLAPNLDLDDFATRLNAGKRIGEICAGQGVDRTCIDTHLPEAEIGEHLVLIADLRDDAFAARVTELNEWLQMGTETQVWLLCDATEAEKEEWYWTHAPAFDVRIAPLGLLRPLYRRLPRSFRVSDGTVTQTYDGLPPLKDSAGSP